MIYVGVHRTEILNDGYMGSGILLKKAYKKYGKSNFKKEIIMLCESEEDMFKMESQIVTSDFVKYKTNYNTMVGGPGGPKVAKEHEYYTSGDHIANALAAREKALIASKKLKDKRIADYYKNPKLCCNCNVPLKYNKKRNKFCSKSCSASYNNSIRVLKKNKYA